MESLHDGPHAVDVAALARQAALPLEAARIAAVHAVLAAWLPDANALSRKMSDPAHQALVPVTVFTHAHKSIEPHEDKP